MIAIQTAQRPAGDALWGWTVGVDEDTGVAAHRLGSAATLRR